MQIWKYKEKDKFKMQAGLVLCQGCSPEKVEPNTKFSIKKGIS